VPVQWRSAAVPGCGFRQRLAARTDRPLDSRGETPLEPAGEDARATLLPHDDENSVKMHPYAPENEVIITVGVSEGLDLACRALINPGDKVMYHQPCYVSYSPSITLAHGVAVPVPTFARDHFALTVESLRAAWQPGCKLLMLSLPCNPTGGTCDRAQIEAIAKFVVEKDLIVLSDEIYSELTFEGVHTSIASIPGMKERTIFLHGFSKAFAMTGWRIGYAAGPKEIINAMTSIQSQSTSNPTSISLKAATEAYTGPQESVETMRVEFEKRRNYIVERLNKIKGIHCTMPQGAFYVFPNIKKLLGKTYQGVTVNTCTEFASYLLEHAKIAVVPGDAFNAPGYMRLSYATSMENIKNGLDRLEASLK